MSYNYFFNDSIDLFVKDRIGQTDANRQAATAKAILDRLKEQPGLILADEVGMGKTFVALAVAVSVYLRDKKPVVIMIPPNLINKWPNDFKLFKDACITNPLIQSQLRCGVARRPEEFLKLLDDEEGKRCAIIFLTHGALARNVSDGWIKLAIIQKALFRRKDTDELYKSLSKYAGSLLEMLYLENRNRDIDIWDLLLKSDPGKWQKILIKHGFEEQGFDDPVPVLFTKELENVTRAELDSLYWQLRTEIPKRESGNLKERLRSVRLILTTEAKEIWSRCLSKVKLDLPLLIFDEAHHLKNSQTQLVTKLFHDPLAEEDAGILTKQFDRMLFLTATPFQLGHHELFRVLERFVTINWESPNSLSINMQSYREELNQLLKKLDDSQIAARKLDNSWGKLTAENLKVGDNNCTDVYEWWNLAQNREFVLEAHVQKLLDDYQIAKEKLALVEPLLKKYVIRHLKPRELADMYAGVSRRNNLPGNLIINNEGLKNKSPQGLEVTKEAMLSFLIAARLTTLQQDKRPVFAEGLASSFEAFRYTREEKLKKLQTNITDLDDDMNELDQITDKVSSWYLDELNESLRFSDSNGSQHPKIKPTVDKAMELWNKGEKVLIFCHYIATGKALRKYMSQAMKNHIRQKGSLLLKCSEDEVFDKLEKIADRISDKDSPLHKKCLDILTGMLNEFKDLENLSVDILEVILRYMRTPSFLIRFASSGDLDTSENWVEKSFAAADESGVTLKDMILGFLKFLNNRKEDREVYISDLKSIQPGGIRVKDINVDDLEEDELTADTDNTVMANVRLCYGATKQETRQKLMKTFNTPFFPDILITSNVMAEGVDLHLSCRHIIHHDLCWNPSTLEQRTGRIDRIGAKAEKCGKSIQVYLPYISETQDEKMYRVVTERERWFNVVMGEKYKVDAASTDKYAERIPFPEELAKELSFNLEVK